MWVLCGPAAPAAFCTSVLRHASGWPGFLFGRHVAAELSILREPRLDDGRPGIGIAVGRGRMIRIACGLPPRELGA
jgi:hypothetical protein